MNSHDLEADIAGCADAHRRLIDSLVGLTDSQARQPSLLPGWSVGHVLTHLARNADSFVRMIRAADAGEIAAQYPGGVPARAADIEAGAHRPAAELLEDLTTASTSLELAFADTTPLGWAGRGVSVTGELAIDGLPFRRWGEVEIHRIDLGNGYGFDDLPATFVRLEITRLTAIWASRQPMGLATLPQSALEAPPSVRLAWLTGRAEIDGVGPAGVYG